MQRVAHLGTQRVTRAEPAGQHVELLPRLQQRVPERARTLVGGDQLVAALAGVAGAADHDADALEGGLREGHVVVADRQSDAGDHLVGLGALDGEHGVVAVVVVDGHTVRGAGVQVADHLGGVGRDRTSSTCSSSRK